jgi:hypothetical protein
MAQRWGPGARLCATVVGCLVAGLLVTGATTPGRGDGVTRVLQLNLCNSGDAGCFTGRAVDRAAAVIRAEEPDVVTLNEVCRGDLPVLERALAGSGRGGATLSAFRAAMDRRTGLDFSWAWQARGLNYNLVISIMVCLFVGRVVVRLSRRCAGFHAPAGVLS